MICSIKECLSKSRMRIFNVFSTYLVLTNLSVLSSFLTTVASTRAAITAINLSRDKNIQNKTSLQNHRKHKHTIRNANYNQICRFSECSSSKPNTPSSSQTNKRNMAKFCANLSFIFTDVPFIERYAAASRAGFKAVESGFPYQLSVEEVVTAKKSAGIQQVLINVYTGDVTKGELGFAAIPGEEENFKKSIASTIEYAKALDASKIHVMSGKVSNPTAQNDQVYEDNLRYAAKLFEKENILGLIEPINKYSVPGYYLNSYEKALKILKAINSPNLRLMLDIFHLQHIQGNITHTITELKDWIGHVQIAQVPDRNEPDTPGEINYPHVFKSLRTVGYEDWIGLEYKPQGDPVAGLKWIKSFGYTL